MKGKIAPFSIIALLFSQAAGAVDLSTTDVFAVMKEKMPEAQIVKIIACNKGKYELDPKAFVYRYYWDGTSLPANITEAMKQANTRNQTNAPRPQNCPIVRTRMLARNLDVGYSSKIVLGASPTEANGLKYVYISSGNAAWKARAKQLLTEHGGYEVVDTPEEAELFIQINPTGGTTVSRGTAEMGGFGGTPTTYHSYQAAEMYARWYKKDDADPNNVEERRIYYRFQKGGNALDASFKHFFAAVDGPKPKEDKRAKAGQ